MNWHGLVFLIAPASQSASALGLLNARNWSPLIFLLATLAALLFTPFPSAIELTLADVLSLLLFGLSCIRESAPFVNISGGNKDSQGSNKDDLY
jgi:hypothetical protein